MCSLLATLYHSAGPADLQGCCSVGSCYRSYEIVPANRAIGWALMLTSFSLPSSVTVSSTWRGSIDHPQIHRNGIHHADDGPDKSFR